MADSETQIKITADTSGLEAAAVRSANAMNMVVNSAKRMSASIVAAGRSALSFAASNLGLQLGLYGIVRASFEANKELGKLQKQLTGALIASRNWKDNVDIMTRYKASVTDATTATAAFEEAESRLAIDMGELVGAFRFLSGPLMGKYGMSAKDATAFTIKAAGAAKVLNTETTAVGMAVTRLLQTRQIRGTDPVANLLRSAVGNAKDLKKMAPDKLLQLVSEKMSSMGGAAEAMSQSLEGTLFRLSDFFKDTLRDIGMPTFKFIAKKVEEWRKSLEAMVGPGEKLVDVYGKRILEAVKSIVSLVETVADHWKLIAVTVAGIKLHGLISGIKDYIVQLRIAQGLSGGMAPGIGAGIKGAAGVLATSVGTTAIVGVAIATVVAVADEVMDSNARLEKVQSAAAVLQKAGVQTLFGQSDELVATLDKMGALLPDKRMSDVFAKSLAYIDQKSRNEMAEKLGVKGWAGVKGLSPGEQGALLGDSFGKAYQQVWGKLDMAGRTEEEKSAEEKGLIGKPRPIANFTGPITIRQEFKEADPDNVFIEFRDALESEAHTRTQATGIEVLG
jgi:hypothetical protein